MFLAGQMCHFFEFSIFGLDRHQHDSLIQILQLFGSIIDFRFSAILKNSVFDFFENFKVSLRTGIIYFLTIHQKGPRV